MINAEYIIDNEKSLLTIMFNKNVLDHMKAKCDDYVNFYQSKYNINLLTLFKSDTGYRIIRVPKKKKTYQVHVRHRLLGFKEFELTECIYFFKKNGFVRVKIRNKDE